MKRKRQMNRALLGTMVLVIGSAFVIGVFGGAIGPQLFAGSGHTVTAIFQNAQQLKPGDEVRVQGVDEGSVTNLKLDSGGRSTTVTMSVANSAGPLYQNATATLAWKTLLGGAFNVDLSRGDRSAGRLGSGPIPISRTTGQVEVEDVLSVDNGGAKTGLRAMFPQLAVALLNPKPPAQLLGTLANVAPSVTTGVGALRGLVPDSDLRALVTGTASTVRALNAPDNGLRTVVQGAAATVSVTAARASDLKSAFDEATPAMDQTKTTFAHLTHTFSLANPLLRSLSAPAREVAPTVEKLYPTVLRARNLLDTAVPLLDDLPPTLRSLRSTSQQGLPLLDQVQPTLDRLQNTILPYLNTVDPGTDHTTAEMIGPTAEALGPDIAGQEDENGHFIRFPATAGSSPLYLPCNIYAGNPAYKSQLIACSSLQSTLSALFGYDPVSSLLNDASGAAGSTSAAGTTTAGDHTSGGHGASATPAGGTTTAASTTTTGTTTAGSTTAAGSSAPAQPVGGLSSVVNALTNLTKGLGGVR
jgi:virulence factor Mce-like protein